MSTISISAIQSLREQTGVGMMDAKRALEATGGDIAAAVTVLRKAGKQVAEKKAARATKDGVVGVYAHGNKKLLAAVSVACETDFVAKTDAFQEFAHDLAMQVAAASPLYLTAADIPTDVVAHEEEIARSQAAGKPEKVQTAIVQGKLQKYAEAHCLLQQKFFKDDTKIVGQLLEEMVQKFGENIQVKEFVRLTV